MRERRSIIPNLNRDSGKVKKKLEEEDHHILPRSMGGSNTKENIVRLYSPVHFSFHRIFGNCGIRGQLAQLVKINEKALQPEMAHRIIKLIVNEDPDFYYKNGIYVPR